MALVISEWEGDDENVLELRWKRRFILPYPLNPAAARVVADSYPVTFKLYDAGGVLRTTRSVADDTVFRLPGGYVTDVVSIEVMASSTIRTIHIAETIEELYNG